MSERSRTYGKLEELTGVLFESEGNFGRPEFHGYVLVGGVSYKFTTLCKDSPDGRRRWNVRLAVAAPIVDAPVRRS